MYALDASVAIFAFRREEEVSTAQQATWKKAQAWLETLPATTAIVLPLPAVGEFLYGLADQSRADDALAVMVARFRVMPFDTEAARMYAEVARRIVGPPSRHPPDWRKRKVDMQIIAIAVRVQAGALITEDEDQRKWASHWIAAMGIPDPPPRPLKLPGL